VIDKYESWNGFLADAKHMLWLFKQMVVNFLKGDIDGAVEAYYFVKIHWNYKSKRIR
jgi:hypothetical protein